MNYRKLWESTYGDIPKDDKLINDVLSGGYNVQPVPIVNSLFIDKSIKQYDSSIIMIDILLILGYATSDDPKYIGTKVFPSPPNNPGITKKKIISNPCKVILRLQKFWFSGGIILLPEEHNSNLISTDNIVPDKPNRNVESK